MTIPAPPSPVGPIQTIALNAAGIQIVGGPTITIICGDVNSPSTVTIGPQGVTIATAATIELIAGASILSMSPAGIQMTAPTITMTSGGAITQTAGGIVSITALVATVTAAAMEIAAAVAFTVTTGLVAIQGVGGVMLVSAAEVFKSVAPDYIPTAL